MKLKQILFCVVFAVASLSFTSLAAGQQGSEDQPHMQSALDHLQQAEDALRAATHDKGGHRTQALQLINQATREVKAGIQYDDTHQSGTERGGTTTGNPGEVSITNGPVIERLDNHSAVVAWSTNVQGSSRVEYGTNRNDLVQIAEAPWGAGGLTHRVTIDNLRPNTTYYFNIETDQARGSGSEVEGKRTYSFRTVANGVAPLRDQQPR